MGPIEHRRAAPAAPSAPPPDAGNRAGVVATVSDACARAVAVSALAALPSAMRAAAAGGSLLAGWLVATAVALPFVVAALLFASAAGRGLRYFVARRSPRAVVLGLALWVGLALGPLALVAAVLKQATHHRGLGGGAFGAAALVVVVLAALAARKLVALFDALLERGAPPAIVAGAGVVVAVLPMVFAAAPLGARGGSPADGALRAAVLDGAILLVATALAASVDLRDAARKLTARVGVPLAVVVVLAAGARVASADPLKTGGLAGAVLAALRGPDAASPFAPPPDAPASSATPP